MRTGWLILLLWLTAGVSAAFAQQIKIKGLVADQDGVPLPFANVQVEAQEKGALTNMDGYYELTIESKELIVVKFSYSGYPDVTREVKNPTGDISLDVTMSAATTDVVEIESAAKIKQNLNELSISTMTLNTKQIDVQASTNLISTLEQTPGITINKDQPSIRGSSGYTYGAGSRVIALLDGLPMLGANRSSVTFDMLPTDNIAQIEVIKGASSVLYGSGGMGGVINVVTKEPSTKARMSFRSLVRFYDTPPTPPAPWDTTSRPLYDFDGRSGAINASLHFFYAKKFKKVDPAGATNDFDLTTQLDLIKQTGYIAEAFSNRVRALVMMKYHVRKGPLRGLDFGANVQTSFDSTATVLYFAGYPAGQLQAGTTPSYQWLPRYVIDPYLNYVTDNGDRFLYRGRWFRGVDSVGTGQSGVSDLHYHEFQWIKNFSFLGRGTRNFTTIVGGNWMRNQVDYPTTFGQAYGDQFSAFAQAELKFIKDKKDTTQHRLNVSLGARWQFETMQGRDITQDTIVNGELIKSPTLTYKPFGSAGRPIFRAGANYRLGQATYFRASWGQGVRSPSVAERFTSTAGGGVLVSPNPDVAIEEGYTAEIGVRQLFKFGNPQGRSDWKGFVDVSGFTMQFQQLVEFQLDRTPPVSGGFYFNAQNLGEASITGVEGIFQIDGRIGQNFYVGLNGGVTWINPINKKGAKVLDNNDDGVLNTNPDFGTIFDPRRPDGTPLQNLDGTFNSAEDEALYTAIINDQPYTLKYRNNLLVRLSGFVSYKNVTLTVNHRYTSFMTNVDRLFFLVPGLSEAARFRQFDRDRGGYHLFDAIFSYNIKTPKVNNIISFHCFNIFNVSYFTIPGTMGEQRSFALQYKIEF